MRRIVAVFALCLVFGVYQARSATLDDDEEQEKMKKYKEECIPETGVERSYVDDAELGILRLDEKLACYAACMMKKVGVMRADGSINDEVAISKIPSGINQEKATEVFHKCKRVPSKNHCLKAGLMAKCFVDNQDYVLGD
uniref:Odorant binding protein 6 n=1 Tax=Sclerodermus sp. MQW-2015 TaxID=1729718 RepID=A0A0N9K2E9_9HYME|nr:odorant binding protein 6 [Sclerodermus sp. MQW-2015]